MALRTMIAWLAWAMVAVCPADAVTVTLAPVFGDHMVIQRDRPIRVFGSGDPHESITVTLGQRTAQAKVDAAGRWLATLGPMAASSEPIELRVDADGGNRVTLSDVLVGDVWLAAGQSNMGFPLAHDADARVSFAHADRPAIRLLHRRATVGGGAGAYTPRQIATLTDDRMFGGVWRRCDAASAADFSAVGLYFAVALHEAIDVPIGIVQVAVGGAPAEAFIDRARLAADAQLAPVARGDWLDNPLLDAWCRRRARENLAAAGPEAPRDALGLNHPFKPGAIWSAGVEPLAPFALRGVLWYQGESNAESAARVEQHGLLFPLLIASWRAAFADPDLPVLVVQLPGMNRPYWPAFRDQQRRLAASIPHVGLAVTIDLGERDNVHPTRKAPVGERLARLALGMVYARPGLCSGPVVRSATFEGDAVRVRFDRADGGLTIGDDWPLRGFELAGADGRFHVADATIDGATVVVSSPGLVVPASVRYAWSPYPEPMVNLVNRAALPASPFEAPVDRGR